ncbi:peptidylprolyl isomerase [Chlamydiota bacterium]
MKKKINLLILVLFSFSYANFSVLANEIDRIVAIVNDEIITQSDIDFMITPLYAKYKDKLSSADLTRKMEEARKEALQQLIDRTVIIQEAQKKEIKVSDDDIDKRLSAIRKKFNSEEEFLEALRRDDLTVQDMKEKIREQLLIKKITREEVTASILVSPKEIESYYVAHKYEFGEKEKVKISHILVKKSDTYDVILRINDIHERLKGGEDFQALARKHSQGPHAKKGGDIGYIEKGQMLPEIEQAAFSLDVGEISKIIKSDIGFHIIKVHLRKEERIKPLLEVWVEIKEFLFQKKAIAAHTEWVRKLRKKSYIEIIN